jgi:hypothetical protein
MARGTRYCAVVDPKGKHNSHCDEELVETGETATDGSRGILRDI